VDRTCDRECVTLERRSEAGEWERRRATGDLDVQVLPAGSAETLSVWPHARAWPPGDYRLTLRVLDASGIPLAVTREFTLNAWPAATVRSALKLLEASESQACGSLELAWSLLFDHADSAFLVDWLRDGRLRPRAVRHLALRGGHDPVLMAALDRYPDSVRPALSAIDESEGHSRPLAAAATARLIDQLATSGGLVDPDSRHDGYAIAKHFAKLWPAGTQARLIDRLAVAPESEVTRMLGDLFCRYGLFKGYDAQIRTVLVRRCAVAGEELRAMCDDALPLYGPMREDWGWRGTFHCGTKHEKGLACDAMHGWDELVAGADKAPVVWRDNRVTRPGI
jgi:hypothetical protein